jgi:RNA polymerase sigma-70 factor (ECF subfamily)
MSACVTSVAGVNDLPSTKRSGADSLPNLVARAQAGDGEAFATLFEQHKKRVYSLCLLMTGDVADAEDLTQDAFIQVFRKLGTFRGDSAFSTWLYRVAVNTVLMSLRKRKPKQISLDEPVCIDHSFVPRDFGRNDPELSGTVDRIALIRAIKELPEGYRKIFLLHEVEGYQHHEIAAMLRCSVGNSKSQLHKAKLKIRELLMLENYVPQNDKEAVPVHADAEVNIKAPVATKLESSFSDADYFPDDLVSAETYTTIPMPEQRG